MGHQEEVHKLASAYQRIPAATLAVINKLVPLNVAVLAGDVDAVRAQQTCSCHNAKHIPRVAGKWTTHRFTHSTTLQMALLQIETINAKAPLLFKIQLNFTNGAHVQLERANPTSAETLQGGSLYDPSGAFRATTLSQSTQRRQSLRSGFLVDDKGRALKPNPHRLGSFDERVLYKHAPTPGHAAQTGFAFTPMSMIAFQQRPSTSIAGCRPDLRETNPGAVHYRPRLLTRPLSPNCFEAIDERNRSISTGRVRPGTFNASASSHRGASLDSRRLAASQDSPASVAPVSPVAL